MMYILYVIEPNQTIQYPFLFKLFTFAFLSSLVLVASRRRVVIWNPLVKPYRLVLLPTPNIDLLSMYSTKTTPRKSFPAPKSLRNFNKMNRMTSIPLSTLSTTIRPALESLFQAQSNNIVVLSNHCSASLRSPSRKHTYRRSASS